MSFWSGYYQQFGSPFQMRFQTLTLQNGKINGYGLDTIGNFQINGTIYSNNNVQFIKQYIEQHKIFYRGVYYPELKLIQGMWGFDETNDQQKFQISIKASPN